MTPTDFELIAIMPGKIAPPDGLTAVVHSGLTAILDRHQPKTRRRALGRKALLQGAAQRQLRLEAMMPAGTVLAVQPGTRLNSEQTTALLAANHVTLQEQLRALRGKVQFQIDIQWARAQVLDAFRETPEIAPLFQESGTNAVAIEAAILRLSDRLRGQIAGIVMPLARDAVALPCDADGLWNHAILIDADAEPLLDRALEDVDAIWSAGLRIRQIGPAPAASFALVTTTMLDSRAIRAAMGKLGLAGPAAGARLDSARKAALRARPDDAGKIRQAARIVAAAALLPAGSSELPLCDIWSEHRGTASTADRKVA